MFKVNISLSHPSDFLTQYHIIIAQLPYLTTNRPSENSTRFYGDWQFRLILMQYQLLYTGEWGSFEPEVTIHCGLNYEMFVSIPADTQYDLTLLIANGFTHQEVAFIIQ